MRLLRFIFCSGPGFLFTYIIAANLILLNVFLSIICEACDQVNGEVAQQENDFEVKTFQTILILILIKILIDNPFWTQGITSENDGWVLKFKMDSYITVRKDSDSILWEYFWAELSAYNFLNYQFSRKVKMKVSWNLMENK